MNALNPLPYVGWAKVLALFDALGAVKPRTDGKFAFRIGSGHH